MSDVKTLYLLRHAKSSWDDPGLADHDRPLAPRGQRAVRKLSRHMHRSGVAPELVLCSSSVRTRETLEGISGALGGADVRIDAGLYAAPVEALLDAVRAVEPGVGSVMLIGHNPGLQWLAIALAGSGDEDGLRRLAENLPTGALATLSVHTETWAEVEPGSCELVGYVVPRELR